MKQRFLLKTMLLLCALVAGSSSVWAADKWVKTAPADLTTGDIVVIVDQTSGKAMTYKDATSAPTATAVTLNDDKDEITSEVGATLQWTLTTSGSGDSKTFQFGYGDDYLTVSKSNNGVRVGSTARNTFTIVTGGDNDGYYLYNIDDTDERYVGCYNSQDWRCYNSINTNIKGNNNAFYKKTTVSGAVDPSVTISGTTIAVGGTATISFPADLTTISFGSDDESVATVSDAGEVSGIAAGSATITATWTAVDGTYNAGSQEFAVTVIEATVYNKVTRVGQLVAGNEYILVATDYNKAMGAAESSIRGHVDVTISSDQVSITDEAVAVLTLGGSTGEWTFLASDNSKYLALTSASNAIHSSDDATDDGAKWTITEDFELENNSQSRYLRYNSGSPRFACYTSGQQTAVLFVKAGSPEVATVTITDAEYATYCNATKALDFSATGITVYTAEDKETSVALNEVASGKIPANTPVVLYKAGGGAAINVPIIASADAIEGTNDLRVSTGTDVENMYVLSKLGGKVGFYPWGGTNLSAGKIYLQGKASYGAREFIGFGDATGIDSVTRDALKNGKVYNLQGQEVKNATKGIFIVNGKKVFLK